MSLVLFSVSTHKVVELKTCAFLEDNVARCGRPWRALNPRLLDNSHVHLPVGLKEIPLAK